MADNDAYLSSELTDVSEYDELQSEQQQRAKAKKKARGNGDGSGYRIQNALKVPRATTYTASNLYEMIVQSDIDLDPVYQRAVVWHETKQIGLIDSIFRNYYIPPVIFAVKHFDDGTEARTCIDGKQRLTSIYRFMSGQIPHKDPVTKEVLWFKDDGRPYHANARSTGPGKPKVMLPEKYRTLFANKQVVCVEYSEITDMDERDVFQRVQLGMALSASEKLQVVASARSEFVRDIIQNFVNHDAPLATNLEWDRTRGNDFRYVAASILTMQKWMALTPAPKTNRRAVTSSKIEIPGGVDGASSVDKWLKAEEDLTEDFKGVVQRTFEIFQEIAGEEKLRKFILEVGEEDTTSSTKPPAKRGKPAKKAIKFSQVEFTQSVVLIQRNMDVMTIGQLAASIRAMRKHIRSLWVDIRANNRITKDLLRFISVLDPKTVVDPIAKKESKKRKSVAAEPSEENLEDDSSPQPVTKRKRKSAAIGGSVSNRRRTSTTDATDVSMDVDERLPPSLTRTPSSIQSTHPPPLTPSPAQSALPRLVPGEKPSLADDFYAKQAKAKRDAELYSHLVARGVMDGPPSGSSSGAIELPDIPGYSKEDVQAMFMSWYSSRGEGGDRNGSGAEFGEANFVPPIAVKTE
ncbi:hypothetical protein DL96DRAFT_1608203 [Flagelloscypha sp. PMI_526]|nr:hypothetical protein DL96DRAFT_1608203 [Flagelloscypha sp. PMI_526]